ncbi:MAG: MFS transporter [Bacillota bacterium]|nr:MFS transporter [Bacillota bacterium]
MLPAEGSEPTNATSAAVDRPLPATRVPRAVWALSGAHLLNDLMLAGVVPALLPLYRSAFHLSYAQAGAVLLVSNLTSSVMQPLFGYVTDRLPRSWFLPLGVSLCVAGVALTGAAPSYGWVLALVTLAGLGSGLFHPEASRATHLAAGPARGAAQAVLQVGGNLGMALGPLAVSLLILRTGLRGLLGFLILALAALLLTGAVLPWYGRLLHREALQPAARAGRNRPWALALLVLVVVMRSWSQIGVAGFLPMLYSQRHIPLARGELLTFVFLLAGAAGTYLGGLLSDRIGRKWLLLGSMLLSIPFAWLVPQASGLLAVATLVAFGFSILSSFAVTVVYGQMLLPSNVGLASGLMVGFSAGMGGLGAMLLGSLADRAGLGAVFTVLAWLPVAGALLTLPLPHDRTLAGAA